MMAVTGVLLTYEAQLNRWALRGYLADPHLQVGAPLKVDQLIPRVADPDGVRGVSSVALKRDPREPAVVRLDDGATVYVDRYTGELLGDGNTRMRRFLRSVMYVHRWFGLEGEYRIIGRTFTATANLGFLFLVLSGAYLWWPSAHSRAAWRQVLWFRRGLRGRARNFNWHSVIGFWSAVPLAIIIASGATISYRWAGNLVYRLAGEAPPAQTSGQQTEPVTRDDPAVAPDPALPTVELQAIADKGRRRDTGLADRHSQASRGGWRPSRGRGRPRDGPPAPRRPRTFCSTVQQANWSAAQAIRHSAVARRSVAGCGLRTRERSMASSGNRSQASSRWVSPSWSGPVSR